MDIICVCGLGMGSSLILKMTVESAMKQLGVACDVEHWAAGTMEGMKTDLIVAADDFRDELLGRDNVVFVKSIINVDEVKETLKGYMQSKGIL